MDIEASLERLQKLREWQIEQHEKLLKQQQMQIEVLSHEHEDRISKALSLTICDLNDINENTENVHAMHEIEINTEPIFDEASVFQSSLNNSDNVFDMMDEEVLTDANALYETCKDEETKNSNHILASADKNRNSVKRYNSGILSQEKELSSDLLIEGIKPLSLDNVVSNRCISIDDIPLPSPKKDFQTLLEEKLKRESEAMSNARIDVRTKPKKPFLKKGEGLSRFKITKNSKQPTTMRKHSTSLSSKQCIDKSDKSRKSTIHKDVVSKSPNNFVISGKRQLNLKTVPLPRNKIFNKSENTTPNKETAYNAASNRSKYLQEMNMSDSDSKTERELEEVRIFELLEEKAENSSFCSTSSTVLAFLQQSTPFKIKKRLNCAGSEGGVVASTRQQDDERTDDTIERESQRSADKQVANLKPRIQHQFEHFGIHKRSHISAATIDPYSDTVTVNDMQEEIQKHSTIANQVSQNNKVHTDYLKNHDIAIIAALSSDSDEGDISKKNNVARNSETDANHRVRFSEYNEYRTIDLSDTADKSPLREHLEQQDWNDHSIDSSELSDVGEENLPLNDEKQMSSLKVMSNEKTILSRRSFLQENIRKTVNIPEEENAPNCENESPGEDIYDDNECTIMEETQTSDEEGEQSVLSSLSSSSSLSDAHRGLNTHKRKEYILRNEPEKITVEKIAKIRSNAKEIELYHQSEDRTNRTNGFESELLKSRLLELQKEIDIFRKESAALLLQRRNLQEDQTILRKEYAEKERNFEENRRRVENRLEEEKKKLSRERIAMENRIRDAQEKAKQNKMERHKAQTLQEQLEKLRDELNIRESRWHAAESRYKSELRVLRVEISKLKEEIATLQNIKRTNIRNIRKSTSGQMITKAINQINKRIIKAPSKELPAKISQVLSDTSSDASVHDDDDNDEDKDRNKSMESIIKTINVNDEQIDDISVNNNKVESKAGIDSQPKCNKTFANENIAKKKQYLYENLLKEATSDILEDQNPVHKQDMNESTDTQLRNAKNDGTSAKTNDKSHNKSHHKSTNEDLECTTACAMSNTDTSFYRSCEMNQNSSDKDDIRMQNRTSLPEKSLNSTSCPSSLRHRTSGTNTKDIGKQIQYSDGHAEYWYLNGNVKKVFPDRGITKMIYYNGDVRETDKDGKVKYFYATTRTWHTTTPDGLEILEFPEYVFIFLYILSFYYYIYLLGFILDFYLYLNNRYV